MAVYWVDVRITTVCVGDSFLSLSSIVFPIFALIPITSSTQRCTNGRYVVDNM